MTDDDHGHTMLQGQTDNPRDRLREEIRGLDGKSSLFGDDDKPRLPPFSGQAPITKPAAYVHKSSGAAVLTVCAILFSFALGVVVGHLTAQGGTPWQSATTE